MGKGFRGKTCVYCGVEGSSSTADHVVAREFFPPHMRGNLPKVPACKACNNAKAIHEHYLTTVLPFAGKTAVSSSLLNDTVPRRLANNAKLHAELAAGSQNTWVNDNGMISPSMRLPFDGERLSELCRYIGMGLIAHHWGRVLPSTHSIRSGMLIPEGEAVLERLLAGSAKARIVHALGDDVFRYEGAQSESDPDLTVWKMSVYGGAQFSDASRATHSVGSNVWVISSRKEVPSVFDL